MLLCSLRSGKGKFRSEKGQNREIFQRTASSTYKEKLVFHSSKTPPRSNLVAQGN